MPDAFALYRSFVEDACSPDRLDLLPNFLHPDVALVTSGGRFTTAFAEVSSGSGPARSWRLSSATSSPAACGSSPR